CALLRPGPEQYGSGDFEENSHQRAVEYGISCGVLQCMEPHTIQQSRWELLGLDVRGDIKDSRSPTRAAIRTEVPFLNRIQGNECSEGVRHQRPLAFASEGKM